MNKHQRIYYILFAAMITVLSCKKEQIMQYEGGSYIQFERSFNDSSLFSFLGLPNKDEAVIPIAVKLTGKPENRDRNFKIAVVKELSTATDANYSLPSSFTLKANRVTDTAWITVKKTAQLSSKSLKLVFKLEPTADLKVGQTDYAALILYISNVLARPDWWNSTVEDDFLGEYSDKKFLLFLQVTGRSELDASNDNELRYYTIQFKNYLLQEKDAGRTVREENGSEMTVALIGE